MDVIFLEYDSWYSVMAYLYMNNNVNFIPHVLYGKQYSFSISSIKCETLDDVRRLILPENSLFDSVKDTIVVGDVQSLSLLDHVLNELPQQSLEPQTTYFVRKENPELTAQERKNLIKTGFKVETLTTEFALKKAKEELKLNLGQQNTSLLNFINSLQSIEDVLNIAYLIEIDCQNHIKNFVQLIEQKTEPFMLPLRPNQLNKDLNMWKEVISEDTIQLALSLMVTKAEKWDNDTKKMVLKQHVMKTDSNIKSSSTLSSTIQWKLLLWNLFNISQTQ